MQNIKIKNLITIFKYFIFFLLISSKSLALETEEIKDIDKWREKIETLDWQNMDKKTFMSPVESAGGSIKIDSSEMFLIGSDVNQYSYWTWGDPDKSLMLIKSGPDTIYFSYSGSGYVSIEDWKNVDTNAMLKELNDNSKAIAQERKAKNLPYVTNASWIHKPQLDRQKNMVYYAYKLEWGDGSITLESSSLVLGKGGYTKITFVTNYDENLSLPTASKRNKNKASTFIYDQEEMYSNYKTGDKVAAVGIGALLATTLGVKAIKPGLLVGLMVLLKKFWFILLLPFIAIGKIFSGKSSNSREMQSSESEEYDSQRTEKSGVELMEEEARKKKKKKSKKKRK